MHECFEPKTEILLATKLKTILDRAEAKDYQDIIALLSAGVSLEKALGAFAKIYGKDPALPLKGSAISKTAICRHFPKPIRSSFAQRGTASGRYPMSR